MALRMELLQSPRLSVQCGYGIHGSKNFRSASHFPVVGYGGGVCLPAASPRKMSLVSVVSFPALSLSCSRKYLVAPTFNAEDPNLTLARSHSSTNSYASVVREKLRTACVGNTPRGGRRKVVREVVLIPSQSRAWKGLRALSKTYSLAIRTIPAELRKRRSKKSNFWKILNTSASSVLSWLRTKRRVQELRTGSGKNLLIGLHWALSWRSFFLLNSTTFGRLPLYCTVRGPLPRLGGIMYGTLSFRCNSSISVSSQAEGNGSLENTIVLTEGLKERQDQYEQQQQQALQKQKQASVPSSEKFLATGYGWRVREVERADLRELIRVADIQTAAFHEPAAMFNDLFYKIFHAEVLSSLQYKARHSAPDRYSCLLAERDPSQAGYDYMIEDGDSELAIVGAVDCTAFADRDVVCHLPGADEYLYISGMAVDSNHRRRSVATLLLEACLARAWQWGFDYLVLHAYEDDLRARSLYSRAGYLTIASDPAWMSKFLGRRRRVVMARRTHQLPEC